MYKLAAEHFKSQPGEEVKRMGIGSVIRNLRKEQGKKAVDLAKLCRIDPRTFAAIENGRIKNPSIQSLERIAAALNVSPAVFFHLAESKQKENVCQGDQKGEFSFEFSKEGFRIVSLTPMIPDFFIGKVIANPNVVIEPGVLPQKGYIFIQVIFGKLIVVVNEKEFFLKEGEHFLLNGKLPHTLKNPLFNESAFLLLTVPSFLGLS